MIEPIYKAMGARIRRRRRELDVTQRELGEAVGLCTSAVTLIEQGKRRVFVHTLVGIANRLDVSLAELAGMKP